MNHKLFFQYNTSILVTFRNVANSTSVNIFVALHRHTGYYNTGILYKNCSIFWHSIHSEFLPTQNTTKYSFFNYSLTELYTSYDDVILISQPLPLTLWGKIFDLTSHSYSCKLSIPPDL